MLSPQTLNLPESLSPKEVSSRIFPAWEVSLQHLRLNKLVSCPSSSLSVPLCQEHCRGHGYKLLWGTSRSLSLTAYIKADVATEAPIYICISLQIRISRQLPHKSDWWCCTGLLWQRHLKMVSAAGRRVVILSLWPGETEQGFSSTSQKPSHHRLVLARPLPHVSLTLPSWGQWRTIPRTGRGKNSAENLPIELQSKTKTPRIHTCSHTTTAKTHLFIFIYFE